eukprot:356154-Chlamydomonas_euryale.AAC.1
MPRVRVQSFARFRRRMARPPSLPGGNVFRTLKCTAPALQTEFPLTRGHCRRQLQRYSRSM